MDVVAQDQVARQHGRAGDGAARADDGGPGDAHAGRHGGVVPHPDVVADHDLVVELDAVAEHGVFQRPAIDRGVGADFDVVADRDAADLGDLGPCAGVGARVGGEAETVGAQHAAGMQNGPVADLDAMVQGDPRVQQAVAADARIGADDAARPEAAALAYAHAFFDHAQGPDADAFADDGRRRNDRRRMYAAFQAAKPVLVEPLRQQGIHEVGLAAQHDAVGVVAFRQRLEGGFGHDDRRRAAFEQLPVQLGIGQEADFRRPRGRKRAQTPYAGFGLVVGIGRFTVQARNIRLFEEFVQSRRLVGR